jgi:hypothetical protein
MSGFRPTSYSTHFEAAISPPLEYDPAKPSNLRDTNCFIGNKSELFDSDQHRSL